MTKIIEHNVATGEIIERDMNADELKTREILGKAAKTQQEAEAQNAKAKAALLEKLGITEDEARLLLG